ncbi:MAG TPA: MBL fold metallo-hydrolase [Acidimicrobiales bacterium]|nr:MBL fold metallo-hydrolase [Acidimicrobiales bacterium]
MSDGAGSEVATGEPDDRSRLRVGEPVTLFPGVVRLLAPNASVMTGPGTNTYLIGNEDLVVIDPGPDEMVHLERIIAFASGKIRFVVVTHSHRDHAPGARSLAKITGATLLGFDARPNFVPDGRIVEGDALVTDAYRLEAVHTPGHSSDHLCFVADPIGGVGARVLFSGDHIMQGSTVVIGPPDGDMGDYLSSLKRVSNIAPPIELIAPGHGMLISDPRGAIDAYLAIRERRESSIYRAILNQPMSAGELVSVIYEDISEELMRHAKRSIWAHLRKLHVEQRVRTEDPDDLESIWERS